MRTLSGEEIIARMVAMDRARLTELAEYTSTRRYILENKRFRKRAETTPQLQYFHPGRKEFSIISESGSSAICHNVFRRMMDSELESSGARHRETTQITPDNYVFHLVGKDSDRGRPAYLFEISPKIESKFMIKGRVWIDAEEFAITRIEGKPARSPSFWVRSTSFVHTYEKFGSFWLAVSNVSHTDAGIFGHTSVAIEYSDYKINPASRAQQ